MVHIITGLLGVTLYSVVVEKRPFSYASSRSKCLEHVVEMLYCVVIYNPAGKSSVVTGCRNGNVETQKMKPWFPYLARLSKQGTVKIIIAAREIAEL